MKFKQKDPRFSPLAIIAGLLLWLFLAYLHFLFFYVTQEVIRMANLVPDGRLQVLSSTETWLYKLFWASMGSALGFAMALRQILRILSFGQTGRTRRRIRRSVALESHFTWTFLFVFTRLAGLLGICYMTFSLQYELDFMQEFWPLFLLLPVVVLLTSWQSLAVLISKKRLQWLGSVCGVFLVFTFLISLRVPVDTEKLNHELQKDRLYYKYGLTLPEATTLERYWRSSNIAKLSVVSDTADSHQPLLFWNNNREPMLLTTLADSLRNELGRYYGLPLLDNTAVIRADTGISMGYMKKLRHTLRKAGLSHNFYSTGRTHSRYPPHYYSNQHKGILVRYHPYFQDLDSALTAMERADLTGKRIKITDSRKYRNGSLHNYNRVKIEVYKDKLTLNGARISEDSLAFFATRFVKKYAPDHLFILHTGSDVSFGKYIHIMDLLKEAHNLNRNTYALKKYGRTYENQYEDEKKYREVRDRFPANILEWTEEELRLQRLVEKQRL